MTPEQLSKWSSVAEVLSSVAILATLVLLLVEISQNTEAIEQSAEATRLASLDSGVEQYSAWRRMLLEDSDLLELWDEGCNAQLSRVESRQYRLLAQEYFFLQRNVFERARVLDDRPENRQLDQTVADIESCPNLRAEFDKTVDRGADGAFFLTVRDALDRKEKAAD